MSAHAGSKSSVTITLAANGGIVVPSLYRKKPGPFRIEGEAVPAVYRRMPVPCLMQGEGVTPLDREIGKPDMYTGSKIPTPSNKTIA